MKYRIFLVFMLFIAFSCKVSKKAVHQPAIGSETEVLPADYKIDKVIKPQQVDVDIKDDKPIDVRTESVKVYDQEVESEAGYAFYVIIGSFSKAENAATSKTEMLKKGFNPLILTTESGLYRVSVDQTNSETDARSFIKHIRTQYPEHNDVWLLKKK
ncbi:MAG TPA: SPOR domain-containing protein [Prolixibacteraceae bacterium]|nr:SPOR domain-containing protein [Prolixibacteraceae bacterium]HPR61106.1 SPOR domain-containing protein [Prolixibacteraceae bacterium]